MMGRERNGLLACLFALLCAFALPQPQAEAAGRVEAVAAHVTASEGLPPLVQQRLAQKNQELMEPFQKSIENSVKSVAEAKGLSVVLEKSSVVYGGQDITQDVINKLSK